MRQHPIHVVWRRLTPIQRSMLQRVARDGALGRLMRWEGRTVRSLVARELLRRDAPGWILTSKARRVLTIAVPLSGPQRAPPGP